MKNKDIQVGDRKKFLRKVNLFKTDCRKLIRLQSKIKTKLTDKAREKCEHQEISQKIILEKSILSIKLNPDRMDKIIEIIYAVAAELRLAGKLERNFEREWGITLADIKKRAGNWNKQKSVKLPRGKTVTKQQYENHLKLSLIHI